MLQEAVAEDVCQQLLQLDPRVSAVQVYIRKPHVALTGVLDSVGEQGCCALRILCSDCLLVLLHFAVRMRCHGYPCIPVSGLCRYHRQYACSHIFIGLLHCTLEIAFTVTGTSWQASSVLQLAVYAACHTWHTRAQLATRSCI